MGYKILSLLLILKVAFAQNCTIENSTVNFETSEIENQEINGEVAFEQYEIGLMNPEQVTLNIENYQSADYTGDPRKWVDAYSDVPPPSEPIDRFFNAMRKVSCENRDDKTTCPKVAKFLQGIYGFDEIDFSQSFTCGTYAHSITEFEKAWVGISSMGVMNPGLVPKIVALLNGGQFVCV